MLLPLAFGLTYAGATPERHEDLTRRLEVIQGSYDLLEHIKSLRIDSVASEIDRLQQSWKDEADGHRMELGK